MSKGDDPKPIRTQCGKCAGAGGTWNEYQYYDSKTKTTKTVRKWIPCPVCGGLGFVNY